MKDVLHQYRSLFHDSSFAFLTCFCVLVLARMHFSRGVNNFRVQWARFWRDPHLYFDNSIRSKYSSKCKYQNCFRDSWNHEPLHSLHSFFVDFTNIDILQNVLSTNKIKHNRNNDWQCTIHTFKNMVLQRSNRQQHGRLDERAVVGIHVCDCCGVQLRELALPRGRACGPRGCVFDGHDGRDCVRGVDVEVEQRG